MNTLSQDPARRCKPVSEWPEGDQQRRAAALGQGTLLEDGGALASHSRSSLRGLDSGYGRWLQWLDNVGELDAEAPPASRVTRERAAEYAETLLNMNGTGTVMERLRSLFYMCRALDPEQPLPWLLRMVAVIRYRHAPVRIKLPRIVEIDELFQLGIRLMESADRRQACRRRQVLQYRNGLIISILAVTFLRREDLSRLCIGQHLVRNKGEWRINIAPSKSRNRRPTPMVFLIPGELTVFVDEYIARCRLALLAMRRRGVSPCDAGNALWIGDDGGPLRYDAIYEIVTRITEQEFGRSVYPHLFRDCSASSTVTRDPEHVGIIPHLLGHKTSATSERHYIHARSYEAARLWQANWLARANEPADPGS